MQEARVIVRRPRRGGLRFVKNDYPRTVDRCIDYFGGRPANLAAASSEACVQWLQRLLRPKAGQMAAVSNG